MTAAQGTALALRREISVVRTAAHGMPEPGVLRVPLQLALFALLMFATGALLLLANPDALAGPGYGSAHALGLTHIFTLGFATSLVNAVLYQFIPANFQANVRGTRRAQIMAAAYGMATALFAVSLWQGATLLAALAGPLLALSLALFLSQMFSVVRRAKRRPLEGWFHLFAFACLAAVAILGSLLATSLPSHWVADPGRWLSAKIVLAGGGWLAMLFMGVSYHTVHGLNASAVRQRLALPTFCCAVAGILDTALLLLFATPPPPRIAASVFLIAAALLFTIDVGRMVRARSTNALPVTWMGQVLSAVLLIVAATEVTVAMDAGEQWAAMALCTLLLGVLPIAAVANGNRIIPVLIANRFTGFGRTPLSRTPLGRVSMPMVLALLLLSWLTIQAGMLEAGVAIIRAGAVGMAAGGTAMFLTVAAQLLHAHKLARAANNS